MGGCKTKMDLCYCIPHVPWVQIRAGGASEPVHQRLPLPAPQLFLVTAGTEIPSLWVSIKAAVGLFALGLLDVVEGLASHFIHRSSLVLLEEFPAAVAVRGEAAGALAL